jgi:hypothetical protein
MFEFKSEMFRFFYLYLASFGESRFLVSWCAGDMCGIADSDDDHGRSKRLDAEDQGWSDTDRVLGGRMIGRSGDVVCGLHHTRGDEQRVFLG